jgi:hypothetical protein
MRRLQGPGFELAFEVRTFSSRIDDNIESLNRPTFLSELAKSTMRKLTDREFLFFSRIEHSTICPAGLVWDKVACHEKLSKDQQRSWLGLGLSSLILVAMGLLGWNGRKWVGVCCGKKEEEENDLLVTQEEEDEKTIANFNSWRRQ